MNCKEIIENLWSNLEQDSDTDKIVVLLKEFDCVIPEIFSDVIVRKLGGYGLFELEDKQEED